LYDIKIDLFFLLLEEKMDLYSGKCNINHLHSFMKIGEKYLMVHNDKYDYKIVDYYIIKCVKKYIDPKNFGFIVLSESVKPPRFLYEKVYYLDFQTTRNNNNIIKKNYYYDLWIYKSTPELVINLLIKTNYKDLIERSLKKRAIEQYSLPKDIIEYIKLFL
jgi:hypothetical protein